MGGHVLSRPTAMPVDSADEQDRWRASALRGFVVRPPVPFRRVDRSFFFKCLPGWSSSLPRSRPVLIGTNETLEKWRDWEQVTSTTSPA